MTNNKKTVDEEVRKIADRIWNGSDGLSHNKLDDIIAEGFRSQMHSLISSLESQKYQDDGDPFNVGQIAGVDQSIKIIRERCACHECREALKT